MIRCCRCKKLQWAKNFSVDRSRKRGRRPICRECVAADRLKNLKGARAQGRKWWAKLKKQIFDHYGHKCARCGFDEPDALSIDHIHGGGNRHRKQLKNSAAFYPDIIRNGFPDGYRTLCLNCQFIVSAKKRRASYV